MEVLCSASDEKEHDFITTAPIIYCIKILNTFRGLQCLKTLRLRVTSMYLVSFVDFCCCFFYFMLHLLSITSW